MLDLPRIRCAPFHESQGADPIGSAGSYDGFLVVDVLLPWEREVTGQEPLASVAGGPTGAVEAGDGMRWRPLARVPLAADASAGRRRVTEHRARRVEVDGRVLRGPYERRDWVVDEADVVAVGRAVLGLDPVDGAEPFDPGATDGAIDGATDVPAAEVLVCTHGRRDQCCGSLGTSMYEDLVHVLAESGAQVRHQRISHTGGHRFAPTAITFPDGYAWGHLDAARTDLLVRRAEPPSLLAAHCRGTALFAGGPAQAADRAGLVELGWDWADAARGVEVVAFDRTTMATTVRATALLPDGSLRAFDSVVVPDRHIPSPTCGIVDGPEYGVDTVWRVDRTVEVEPVAASPVP
ncbi:sucrase ferredoxin [Dermatobacter hominis]|uniref:sucrase ferredoxin n=1 Tax=Dermatobacter hominis TaxID=2884263 RepID=UPI001D11C6E2|nr:sucrase ferredoxin [Dermatobacter hominis]UDY37300.1 hypothetical protein LH044_07110 [Dermatobacter hominis]